MAITAKDFKPGDVVICLRNSVGNCYIKGNKYIVKEMSDIGTLRTVRDEKGSTSNGWGPEFFKLYKPIKRTTIKWL